MLVFDEVFVDHTTGWSSLAKCGECWDHGWVTTVDNLLTVSMGFVNNKLNLEYYNIKFRNGDPEQDYEATYRLSREFSSINVNGMLYKNVKIFGCTDLDWSISGKENNFYIDEIITAKDIGIISFKNKTGKSWTIGDSNQKTLLKTDINLISNECR
jgi:hypothetical protein